jgi:hypothetical protein
MVKELETELGLDEENAKKFHRAVEKIASRNRSASTPQPQTNGKWSQRQQEFLSKIEQAKQSYGNDEWNEMSPYMHEVMTSEMKNLSALGLDPEDAYDETPHSYFAKAVKLKAQRDARSNRMDETNQRSAQNLAGSESSKNGKGQSGIPPKMSYALYLKNRSNPEWVKQNRQALLNAVQNNWGA